MYSLPKIKGSLTLALTVEVLVSFARVLLLKAYLQRSDF